MTPADFTAALSTAGLTQAEFARMTGAHVTTVSRWATGAIPVPGWVPSWLGMYRGNKGDVE